MEPEEVEVDIDLGDDLDVDISLDEELAIDILLEGDTTFRDCPMITEIDGGQADSDLPASSNQFTIINGLLDGGNVNSPV